VQTVQTVQTNNNNINLEHIFSAPFIKNRPVGETGLVENEISLYFASIYYFFEKFKKKLYFSGSVKIVPCSSSDLFSSS
jgi:hypothetical protein